MNFSTLSTAISGLYSSKRALDTVANNLANVNNPGYVRQQVVMETFGYKKTSLEGFEVGMGTQLQDIRQIRDSFLDIRYRIQSSELGTWAAKNGVFEQVQEIVNDIDETGVQKVVDQFWSAWEEVSKNPDNLTMRGLLKERSIELTESINSIYEQLDSLQRNLNKDIENKVDEINAAAAEIRDLNEEIMKSETAEMRANDLRDRRNVLVDKLSYLANVEFHEVDGGMLNVSISGTSLVNGMNYNKLVAASDKSAFASVYWEESIRHTGQLTSGAKVKLKGGELYGLLKARGEVDTTILNNNNGAIKEEVDVIVAYNSSNTGIDSLVDKYQKDMEKRGFGDGNATYKKIPFNNNLQALIDGIEEGDFRANAHRKLIIVSEENPGGDGTLNTDMESQIKKLEELGISVTVVTKEKHRVDGDAGEEGWNKMIDRTQGGFFNIDEISDEDFAVKLAQETTNTFSKHAGVVDSYEEIIPNVKKKLNAFVNTLARNVNYIHRQGYNLNGENLKEDFFVSSNANEPIQAGNITVNSNMDILNNIAVSSSNAVGDGKVGEMIADLREKYLFGVENSDDYYRSIISEIGIAANESMKLEEAHEIIVSQISDQKSAISGVSMDEELADMLKFQHSYAANSRIINVVDQMIDTIVNRMGRVGN